MKEALGIYGCKYIFNLGSGRPVVLLHGYSFTYRVWHEIGLLDRLVSEDISFIAPDMPYGRENSCKNKISSSDENINILRRIIQENFGDEIPVLVGASLGGYICLRYGMRYDVYGMVLIAPVWSTRGDIIDVYREKSIPILLIYGDRDSIVGMDEMTRFKDEVSSTELKIYRGAKHPAYLDYPNDFIEDIINFYRVRLGLRY